MSWEIVQKNSNPHVCDIPRVVNEGVGVKDIIRCTDCQQMWECTGIEYGVQWDPIIPPALNYRRFSQSYNGGR